MDSLVKPDGEQEKRAGAFFGHRLLTKHRFRLVAQAKVVEHARN